MEPFIENELYDLLRITGITRKEKEVKNTLEDLYKSAYREGRKDAFKEMKKSIEYLTKYD